MVHVEGISEFFLNCLRALWHKDYQHRSVEKSHQNGDYFKQAMQKSCPPAEKAIYTFLHCLFKVVAVLVALPYRLLRWYSLWTRKHANA